MENNLKQYKVKKRIKVITTNTVITDTDFSDWSAINTGTTAVQVDKVTLQPSEGIPYMGLQPNVRYDSPIQIIIPDGGEVVLYQLLYKEIINV